MKNYINYNCEHLNIENINIASTFILVTYDDGSVISYEKSQENYKIFLDRMRVQHDYNLKMVNKIKNFDFISFLLKCKEDGEIDFDSSITEYQIIKLLFCNNSIIAALIFLTMCTPATMSIGSVLVLSSVITINAEYLNYKKFQVLKNDIVKHEFFLNFEKEFNVYIKKINDPKNQKNLDAILQYLEINNKKIYKYIKKNIDSGLSDNYNLDMHIVDKVKLSDLFDYTLHIAVVSKLLDEIKEDDIVEVQAIRGRKK